MKTKIVYLDGEEYNRKSFYAHFRSRYNIHLCSSELEVLDKLQTECFDIIILDQRSPALTGFEFLNRIKLENDPLRIVITAYVDSQPLREARKAGNIFDFQEKPWLVEDMEDTIQRAVNYMNWKKVES